MSSTRVSLSFWMTILLPKTFARLMNIWQIASPLLFTELTLLVLVSCTCDAENKLNCERKLLF